MNHIYRLIWNRATGAWVVASEITRDRSKCSAGLVLKGVLSTASFAFALGAGQVSAQTSTWQAGTGDWSTIANWVGGVPDAGRGAIIRNGGNAQIQSGTAADAVALSVGSAAGTSGTLTVQAGGSLTVHGPMEIGAGGGTGVLVIDGGIVTQTAGTSFVEEGSSISLSQGGVLNVAGNSNGGFLSMLAATLTIGDGGGTVTAAGVVGRTGASTSQLIFANTTGDDAFATAIQHNIAVVHSGTHTTTLSGTNTYTGGTTLNAGVLSVSEDANLGNAAGGLTFNGGALQTTATMSMGRATTVNAGGGTFDVGAGTTLTQSGAISGAGALTKSGTGSLALSGANAYSGGTVLNAGVLSVSSDANLGNAAGGLTFNGGALQTTATMSMGRATTVSTGGGTFDVGTGTTLTQSGAISGAGSLTKSGTGSLALSGANNYSGGTVLNAGVLSVSADVNLGNAAGGLTFDGGALQTTATMSMGRATTVNAGGGTFDVGAGTTLTQSGAISGAGALTKSGTGSLALSGANAYSGGTVLNAGVLSVSSDANLGNAAGGLTFNGGALQTTATMSMGRATTVSTGGGTFDVGTGTTLTQSGAISGAGSLTKSGTGSLALSGANNYSGGTVLNAGVLSVSADVNLGNAAGGLTFNGGALQTTATMSMGRATTVNAGGGTFDVGAGTTLTQSGAISGAGALTKSGTGSLTLSGANAYSGGTVLNAGVLSVSADVNLGNAAGGLTFDGGALQTTATMSMGRATTVNAGGGTFDVGAGTTLTQSGAISGAGDFTKAGAGFLMLTGDSSAFAGTTNIVDGLLSVNGKLGGDLNITGGKLGGGGTIGNLSVSGGIVAPGNSIGTLHVGNVGFNPGSIYQVEVNAAGQSDQIVASGTATINGASVQVLAEAGNYAPQTQYTILTASGGRTGLFSGVTSNLAFLDPFLSYDANNAYLTLVRNNAAFTSVGRTRNQIATGGGVNSLEAGNAVYDTVLGLSADQARNAFDQLSGEIQASAQTAMMEDSRYVRNAANDRLRSAFGAAGASRATVAAYVANGQPGQVAATHVGPVFWSTAYGSWGKTDGDGNAAGLDRSSNGLLMGVDRSVGSWRLGVLTGYGQTKFDTPSPSGSGTSKDYHLGAYGGTAWGNLSLRTGMAYTWHGINIRRSVALPGLASSLKNDFHAGALQAFGELAYGTNINGLRVEPFANVSHVRLRTDGSSEQGGVTALQTDKSTNKVTFSTLGLRGEHTFDLGSTKATLIGSVGWRHAMGDITSTATQRFATGSAFTVSGVPIAKNSAVVETGLDVAVSSNAMVNVSYMGQLASGARDHGVKGTLVVSF